nr:MAG TPA: hypothetical protein [Caudoviricetes sp.]
MLLLHKLSIFYYYIRYNLFCQILLIYWFCYNFKLSNNKTIYKNFELLRISK